jgi:hypothetical protein
MGTWKRKATTTGGDFEKAPPGNHPAVLVAIIDLGVQESEYQGVKKYDERAYFCWELTSEKTAQGKNHIIGIDLTVSMNEKAKLRKWIEAWRGKKLNEGEEFDITKLLGQKCLLSVAENKGYSKVDGVAGVPKGMTVNAPEHTPILWSIEEDEGKNPIPDWLPWLYGSKLADVVADRCVKDEGPPAGPPAGAPAGAPAAQQEEEIPF